VTKGANFNEVRRAAEAYFRIYLYSACEPKTTLNRIYEKVSRIEEVTYKVG
jgi:hypothetical protein